MMKIPSTSFTNVSSAKPQNLVTITGQDTHINSKEWKVTAIPPHCFLPLFMAFILQSAWRAGDMIKGLEPLLSYEEGLRELR